MPIRAENKARYPADWPAISLAVKEAAGWRCECEGECGRGTHVGRCTNRHGKPNYGTGSRCVLTTAHLNHTPEDCSKENLKAMCQGCHLHYDRDHHAETRKATLAARRNEHGGSDVLASVIITIALLAGLRLLGFDAMGYLESAVDWTVATAQDVFDGNDQPAQHPHKGESTGR